MISSVVGKARTGSGAMALRRVAAARSQMAGASFGPQRSLPSGGLASVASAAPSKTRHGLPDGTQARQLCLGGEAADGRAGLLRKARRKPRLEYPSLRHVASTAVPWQWAPPAPSKASLHRSDSIWVATRSAPASTSSWQPSHTEAYCEVVAEAIAWPEGIYAPTTQASRLPISMESAAGF